MYRTPSLCIVVVHLRIVYSQFSEGLVCADFATSQIYFPRHVQGFFLHKKTSYVTAFVSLPLQISDKDTNLEEIEKIEPKFLRILTWMGSSSGCVAARGCIKTAKGIQLLSSMSEEAGTQFRVILMILGLAFPVSLTITGSSAGSGIIGLLSIRVKNSCIEANTIIQGLQILMKANHYSE